MKVLFLMAGSSLRQTSSIHHAACIRFLSRQKCRLFEFALDTVSVRELKIPDMQFTLEKEKHGNET